MIMGGRALYVHAPEFAAYRLSPDHPLDPLRLELTRDLLVACGVLAGDDCAPPMPATDRELELFHRPDYIAEVARLSAGGEPGSEADVYELGTSDNPIFPNMHRATAAIVGATLTAAELVMSGRAEHALNIAGGLHHAGADRASGFCIYNDLAVTIMHLKSRYGVRVLYVDTDAHHGDGVQWAFYDDPQVLTISFHETGRYLFPGTGSIVERGRNAGYGYSVNVPLEAFTEDDSWLDAFRSVVPPLVRAFSPDIIVSQNGCDGHYLDPLSHLCATTRLYREIPRLVHSLAHEACGGRWVAVGGGGYDIWRVVPRAWAFLWAELSGRALPERVPRSWLERWQGKSPVPLPENMDDPCDGGPVIPRRAQIEEKNHLTAAKALRGALEAISPPPPALKLGNGR